MADGGGLPGVLSAIALNVVSNLITDGGEDVVGDVIDTLTGGGSSSPEPIQTATLQAVDQVQAQLVSLQAEVSELSSEVSTEITQLQNAITDDQAWTVYQDSTQSADAALGTIVGDLDNVAAIQNTLVGTTCRSQETAGPLNAAQQAQLNDVWTNAGSRLDELNAALIGEAGQNTGLFNGFARVLWTAQGEQQGLYASGTLPSSELMTNMQSFVGQYVQIAAQYMNAYAEAANTLSPDPQQDIQAFFSKRFLPIVQAWSSQWTYNLPALQPGIVVDVNTVQLPASGNGSVSVWTAGSSEGSGSSPTVQPFTLAQDGQDAYCAQAGSCFAPIWEPEAQGNTMIDNDVVPAVLDLGQYLSSPQLGVDTWTAPTTAELDSLLVSRDPSIPGGYPPSATATPQIDQDLSGWATAENIPTLIPRSYSMPNGSQFTVVPPIVTADTQTASVNSLPGVKPHTSPAGSGYTYGGQLMLTAEIVLPELTFTSPAPAANRQSSGTEADHLRTSEEGRDTSANVAAVGGSFSTTSFSAPASCGANQSFTQPAGANAISVSVAGAIGGVGTDNGVAIPGGNGGVISAVIPLAPGTTIYAGIGGAGGQWNAISSDGIGGPGGINGGGPGGNVNVDSAGDDNGITAAGGGGLSQIALDPNCTVPLVVAGGGGGAGNGNDADNDNGGPGGNACMSGGSCNGASGGGQDPAGGGTLTSGGSSAGYPGPGSGQGGAPSGSTGGQGGWGGYTGKHAGAAGGGGGGGFTGGWGGGGTNITSSGLSQASGGGAGGSSFLLAGATSSSFSSNGGQGSVQITPIVASDFLLVDTFASSGYWNLYGEAPQGSAVTTMVSSGAQDPNAALGAFPEDDLTGFAFVPTGTQGQFELIDPNSSNCLTVPDPLESGVSSASLAPCGAPPSGTAQTLQLGLAPSASPFTTALTYELTTLDGTALPFTQLQPGWVGTLLLPGALWSSEQRLVDSPAPPGANTPPTGTTDTTQPATVVSRPARLAATGLSDTPWLLLTGVLTMVGGAGMLWMTFRRRLRTR